MSANAKSSKNRKEYMKQYFANKKDKIQVDRLFSKISSGHVPTARTLYNYGLDEEFVNRVRAVKDLPPVSLYPTIPSYTVEAELAKKRIDKATADAKQIQLDLAKATNNSLLPLDLTHELASELDRVLDPGPIGDTLHYSDIAGYFERRLNFQLKNKLNSSQGETTIRKRINEWKTLFTKIIDVDKGDLDKINIIVELQKLKPSQIFEKYPNPATATSYVSCVLVLLNYPGLKAKLGPEFERRWVHTLQEMKSKVQVDRKHRAADIYPPFSEILEAVEKAFGVSSDQGLLINFYNEHTLRDDYGDVIVVAKESDIPNDDISKATNWMIFDGKSATMLLREYKTQKAYGEKRLPFSSKVVGIMNDIGVIPGIRLFDHKKKNKQANEANEADKDLAPDFASTAKKHNFSLSGYIGKMLSKAGFNQTNRRGNVNFLRHAKVSESLADPTLTDAQRIMLANSMGHSIDTQEDYKRTLTQIKKDYANVKVDELDKAAIDSFAATYGDPSKYSSKEEPVPEVKPAVRKIKRKPIAEIASARVTRSSPK